MFPEFGGQQGPGKKKKKKKKKKIIINELVGSEVGRIRPTSKQPATEKKKRCKLVGSWSHPTNFRPTGVPKKNRCELVGSWSRATNSRPTRSHGKKQSHKTLIVFLFCGEERLFHPYFIVTNASRCLIFFENACDITIFSVFFLQCELVGSWSDATNFRPTRIAFFFWRRLVGSWSDATNFRPTRITWDGSWRRLFGSWSHATNLYNLASFFFYFGWPEVSPIRPTSDHPVGRKLVSTH